MAGSDPRETAEAIHAAINARDVAAVMACFGDDPVFLPPGGGAEVRGRDAVEEAMRAFLATDPKITADVVRCVVTGDVALLVTEWRLEARGADATRLTATGRTADVSFVARTVCGATR